MNILQLITNRILTQRNFYMGVAILLVIFYHCFCAVKGISYLSVFSRGYIGVDIFLFFSGLGLSFSYNGKPLKVFYKNRVYRIMPLYWVWAIVHLIVVSLQVHKMPSMLDVLGLSTTLSYYGLGEIRSNWYLSALLLFYVAFPLLFKFINRWRWYALFNIVIVTAITLYYFDFYWYHDAFIGRFYIFCLGIYFYLIKDKIKLHDVSFVLLFVMVGLVSLSSLKFQYWGASCICPLILIILSLLPNRIMILRPILLCGKYSLEIFIGNCWTMLLMDTIFFSPLINCCIYFLSNVVFASILVIINKKFFKH